MSRARVESSDELVALLVADALPPGIECAWAGVSVLQAAQFCITKVAFLAVGKASTKQSGVGPLTVVNSRLQVAGELALPQWV